MNFRKSIAGLAAVIALGGTIVAPVSAATTEVGQVPVQVVITDDGGSLTLGVASSTGFNFGTVALDASEAATSGELSAGSATLNIVIQNDTKLFNSSDFDITVKLDNGTGAGSYLQPSTPVPAFTDSSAANFQIPGRYLKITQISNPLQAKYTKASAGCANPWNGTGITTAAQCVPRDNLGIQPIYKVSDPVGLAGIPYTPNPGPCRIASGGLVAWDPSCPDPTFTSTVAKPIMHFRAGSGTVETLQQVVMTLSVPAGVYPTTYTGKLIVEKVTAP